MTLVLFATAVGVLVWPRRSVDERRIPALRSEHRLAPAPVSARARSRRPRIAAPGWARRVAVLGPILFATAGTPALGLAAIEFAFCLLTVSLVVLSLIDRALAGRRRAARDREVALATSLLVGELVAGATPAAALGSIDEIGTEIERGLNDDIDEPHDAPDIDDPLARVVVAWQASSTSGVPLVDLLAHVRADLADASATRRELATVIAGPQTTAAVLALLPLLGVALGAAIGADPLTVLVGSPLGRILLCLGVLFDAAGVSWTARLIARGQR